MTDGEIISYTGSPTAVLTEDGVLPLLGFIVRHMTLTIPAYNDLPESLRYLFVENRRKKDD